MELVESRDEVSDGKVMATGNEQSGDLRSLKPLVFFICHTGKNTDKTYK